MRKTTILILGLVLLVPATAAAEQIRLRTGDLLQGEVLGDQSDEETVRIRLYRTGGVFSLPWSRLIQEDEKRLRDVLGLTPWQETDVPTVDGHQVVFVNGNIQLGVAENADAKGEPLVLRTSTGTRQYPRDTIAGIKPAQVPALEVYTPDELYDVYSKEVSPETPAQHVDLAKRLIQVEAYRKAKEHLDLALEDPEFVETEQAGAVKNLVSRVEVFIRAEDALARVREVKKFVFQKKFEQALELVGTIRSEYEEEPAIFALLKLDRLERQVRSDRRSYYVSQIQRRFFQVMLKAINKKAREKEEESSANAAIQWVQTPKGLAQEIFTTLSEDLTLPEREVREFWEARTSRQVRRYNYGGGTFYHPEVLAKTRKTSKPKSGRRTSRNSRTGRGGGAAPRQQQKPKSGEEWWQRAKTKEKENFLRAWFAEFGAVLRVLRFEVNSCKNCGGKGVTISHSAATAEEIRLICAVCNLAGHERVVVCR